MRGRREERKRRDNAKRGPAALTLTCALWAAACGGGAREPEASPTPDERTAVEAAVRGYFGAIADDDHGGKVRFSSGELNVLADWELMVSLSFGSALAELQIDRLEIEEIRADSATADFSAELRLSGFQADPPTVFSGPITLAREPEGWKVVDYLRDGRPQSASIHTDVRGGQERGGVTVEVRGVHLQANAILVVLEATNTTSEAFTLVPASIVAEDGRHLEFGEPSATQRAVLPSSPLVTYVYWSGRSLPEDTTSFRLLLDFTGPSGGLSFDIPVELLD
ncbi:MAG: hypothetical protein H0W94_06595 [Actinobacteria bacterium]|nr:hypothetical protein [Actinomycetota bacterium]